MRLVSPVRILGILLLYAVCTFSDNVKEEIVGSSVSEARGYFRREHSLTKPYQGAGMDIPYWNVIGSTLVSDQQIRLTPDLQSRKGAIWNTVPCYSRDWEMKVTFNVHGQTGTLFGDGMAIWYVQEPNILGDVFGSKDYFRGLGVFLDTYSNHNGVHSHSHPYITAMVSNGSLHYDHDSDGTHTQLGGEHTGCEAKFRNKEHDTQVLIRYVGDTLSIFSDVNGDGVWKECLSVGGVHLPTGLYFGVTAATGDLSDNHDVISLKMYEQEYARAEKENEVNRAHIEPSADFVAAPRDHIDSPKPSKLGWIGTTLLVIIGIVVVVLGLGYGVLYLQNRSERSRKRFY